MAMAEPRKPIATLTASRPLASLSSGLLARKGDARPAMRRQSDFGHSGSPDDLGWNDMGHDAAPAAVPPVLRERERLLDTVALPEPVAAEPDHVKPMAIEPVVPVAANATPRLGRAAFTLRLDEERHLRLRLAAALTHRSAQRLVTAALDRFLATMPELDEVAARLPAVDRPND